MITVKLTPEQLFEIRYCLKRYNTVWHHTPNKYFHDLRLKICDKLTAAYKQFQDNFLDADIPLVPDNTCNVCKHWVQVGGQGNADYGACALDGASIFEDDPACHRFENQPNRESCDQP